MLTYESIHLLKYFWTIVYWALLCTIHWTKTLIRVVAKIDIHSHFPRRVSKYSKHKDKQLAHWSAMCGVLQMWKAIAEQNGQYCRQRKQHVQRPKGWIRAWLVWGMVSVQATRISIWKKGNQEITLGQKGARWCQRIRKRPVAKSFVNAFLGLGSFGSQQY